MKFLTTILLVSALGVSLSQAQSKTPPVYRTYEAADAPHYKNSTTAGGSAGFVNGIGLMYRHWFEQNGFQASLLPIIQIDGENRTLFVDFGATYLHALWESKMADWLYQPTRSLVYSYAGLHYNLDSEKNLEWGSDYMDHNVFAGGGLGFQLNINSIQFSLGLGFAGHLGQYSDYINNSPGTNESPDRSTRGIQPTIDATLGYTFGW
jgi:hypothetical protein